MPSPCSGVAEAMMHMIQNTPEGKNSRIETLERISGLKVRVRQEKNENVFTFFSDEGVTIKECFTYPKAKIFAEGIVVGRALEIRSK
jgi:hypothetical protein